VFTAEVRAMGEGAGEDGLAGAEALGARITCFFAFLARLPMVCGPLRCWCVVLLCGLAMVVVVLSGAG
jgi:hypothetical protein